MVDGGKRIWSLTREFYIAEIGTWENYGGKRVLRFMEGDIMRFNGSILDINNTVPQVFYP